MCPNPEKTADLVTFIEEIVNGKLHFLSIAAQFTDYQNLMYTNPFHTNRVSFY